MAGNCRDDGNAVRPNYWEQRTICFPDGIQITQVFDAPTYRRIDSGDKELIAQIRRNYEESLGSGTDLVEIATATAGTAGPVGSDGPDDTSVGESLDTETTSVTSDVEESGTGSRYVYWTKPATNLLISLYEDFEQDFEDPRKKKKDVWREITQNLNEAGYNFSQLKVENKWRSLVQSHKELKECKKRTGEKRKTFQHFERLDEILAKRHDISPPFTSSSNQLAPKENKEKEQASTSSEEKVETKSSSISAVRRREKRKETEKEGSSFLQAFKEIEKVRKLERDEREKRRDQRAKERNDLLREFLDILKEK